MRNFILIAALCGLSSAACAQASSNTLEYIDINNIRAGHSPYGNMWSDMTTGTTSCEYPKASGKHVAGLGSLWFSGYDTQNNLHVAAQTYRQTGSDYFPGPVDLGIHDTTAAKPYVASWARIWKINKTTIDSFRALTSHTIANTPADILEWPARGNTHAKGTQQSTITINKDLAPFVDADNDGVYNALAGDYPKIKGDQMLWSVFNEVMLPKTQTHSVSMGLEIRQSVYAYKRNSGLDNIVFYEYDIKNTGSNAFSDFIAGMNTDFDLGYAFDDFIGYDSTHRMGYVYNSVLQDGSGDSTSYGADIPVAGMSIMEFPGDQYPALTVLGTFNPYTNGIGNPRDAVEFSRLLHGQNRVGMDMHDDRGSGTATNAYGPGTNTRYAFTGDPSDPTGWSECQSHVPYGSDQRFVLAAQPVTFAAGATKKLGMALVVSPHAGACGSLDLTGLKHLADTALITYYSPPAPLGIHSVASIAKSLKVYPNPTKDQLHILLPDDEAATVSLYDASGRLLSTIHTAHQKEAMLETAQLAGGMYIVSYRSGQTVADNTFIKE